MVKRFGNAGFPDELGKSKREVNLILLKITKMRIFFTQDMSHGRHSPLKKQNMLHAVNESIQFVQTFVFNIEYLRKFALMFAS